MSFSLVWNTVGNLLYIITFPASIAVIALACVLVIQKRIKLWARIKSTFSRTAPTSTEVNGHGRSGKLPLSIVGTICFAVGLSTCVVGYLAGASREPAIGAVLPAILGLFSGAGATLIALNRGSTVKISGVLIVASLNLWVGINLGASARVEFGSRDQIRQTSYENQRLFDAVETEIRLEIHRQNMERVYGVESGTDSE